VITVIGPNDPNVPDAINTTSHSTSFGRVLSPFLLGPVKLYGDFIAQNVENLWQFSKVFRCHVDENENPTQEYWEWAKAGWADKKAHRYPMYKGAVPLYSYWDGKKLTYIEARKAIYIPIYAGAVVKSPAFQELKELYELCGDLTLWDFDGYNHRELGMSYDEVINSTERKMGHAFVISMLIEGFLKESDYLKC